jgi:N-6 DNA Methylase
VSDLVDEIERYGATQDHLVDLAVPSPRGLRFADLMQAPSEGRAPVVVESNGRALIYVVDGRRDLTPGTVRQWVRRIAFRGDADWVGVLRPGRLDVHPAVLDGAREPTLLDDLPALGFRLPALAHKPGTDGVSVRLRLKRLLFQSMKRARKEFSLSTQDALSLVGRALFWRFVVDRGLLDRLEPSSILQGPKSWAACFDHKSWALEIFDWLDDTFNGGLLEFETRPERLPAEVFSSIAGNIAHKTDASGQLALPASWAEVDFAHVPVGLLNEVYEAFIHDADKSQASAKSLFYTPRHLAELVVDEALDALDGVERPRILDPAAGAGVFLVAAFRALVAREWTRSRSRPSRSVVRRILNQQLTGFDIDGNALRFAELALYLTAIELDPERKPRPLHLLRFKTPLRGNVLVEKPGGRLVGSLGAVLDHEKHRFDAVIGNPPWTALKQPKNAKGKKDPKANQQAKKAWADASRAIVAERLDADRAESFEFPDANPDLPFVYRAMEWARIGGVVGLITHARWLFGQSHAATRARNDLLESVHVTGVLNGSALRQTNVWPNVDSPWCMLFAANERRPEAAAFQLVSPELDTVDGSQERLRIDWRDARVVEVEDAVSQPWTLKARFRGTAVDESVVRDVGRRGVPFESYLKGSLKTALHNGYKVNGDGMSDASRMWKLWDLRHHDLDFFIDTAGLEKFALPELHRRREMEIYRAPLLIVHESMVVDGPRSGLATRDIAYDERFDGIPFAKVEDGGSIAAYLQLVLQSSLTTHLLLMLDGQFGVEREVVHKETLEALPIVPWHALGAAERKSAAGLSARLRGGLDSTLQADIDVFVARLHGLSDVQRDAVSETISTGLTTKNAREQALRPTTSTDREEFVEVCGHGLRDVLSASGTTAWIRNRDDLWSPNVPWRFVQVDRVRAGKGPRRPTRLRLADFVRAADAGAASLVVLHTGKQTILVGLLDRFRHWTRTKARLLASELLVEGDV